MFEPNQGQANLDPADSRARFVARGAGYTLLLGSEGARLSLSSPDLSRHGLGKHVDARSAARVESVRMKLADANPKPRMTGADLLPGKSNYLLGNDPANWKRGIPQFARVRYEEIYPGINLVFYGNQGRLEYDFQVGPGADPGQAELEFDATHQLALEDGALVIHGRPGDGNGVRLEAPRVYQEVAGRQQPIQGRFVLRGAHRAGFAIGAYDHSRELIIDPLLSFATYFGGTGDEQSSSIAVDNSGNIYLAGSTNSLDLPVTTGVVQSGLKSTPPATNVYIAKITPPFGSNPAFIDYVTYLGGTGSDTPVGIAVDGGGDPFVAGYTSSPDFPTTGTAYQQTPESVGTHVFVTELDLLAARLKYSSYLSGNGTDIASGMTIDAKGFIYVTGTTTSVESSPSGDQFPASNLPQALPFQSTSRATLGNAQFFVTKVNTNAPKIGSIAYSTYFGGGNFTPELPPPAPQTATVDGGGIAVDANGNIYFTGATNYTFTGCAGCQTTDFPILNAYQPCLDQAPPTTVTNPPTCSNTSSTVFPDAFAAKLNPNAVQGSQLQWSTYLGGSQRDLGSGIALDSGAANVFVTGSTNSPDFVAASSLATFASYQKCLNNVTPTTTGTVTCAAQTTTPPLYDAFVARLSNPTTTGTTTSNVSLTYFSYLGGSGNENGLAAVVDTTSGALLTGWTQSPDFPTFPGVVNGNCGDIQCAFNGTQDAFIARINTAATTGQNQTASWATYYGGSLTSSGGNALTQGTGITLDVSGNTYVAGDSNSAEPNGLQLNKPLQSQNNGGYDAFVTQLGTAASLSVTGVPTLGTNQSYFYAGNQATFTYTLTNSGPDPATGIVVNDSLTNTFVPLTFNSASATSGTCSQGSTTTLVTCSIGSLQSGSTATITIQVTPGATGGPAQFNGGTVWATAANGITTPRTSVSANVSDFSMSVSPSNTSVVAGNTAKYVVKLAPLPVYGVGISLSVSGLPAGTTSSFTTQSVTLQGTSPGTSTLNIVTTARPIITPAASLWTRHFYAVWLGVPGLALFAVGGNRRRRRIAGMLLLCVVSMLLLLQPACSHPASQPPVTGTPAGNYSLTVTAMSGSDTKSFPVLLTVQ